MLYRLCAPQLRYNDASVLENHHASLGWELLEGAGVAAFWDNATRVVRVKDGHPPPHRPSFS